MSSLYKKLLISIMVLPGSLLLSGCSWSWFSSDVDKSGTPPVHQIDLKLVTTSTINPGESGQAQPVKICVVEVNRSGWSPPHLYEGAPCRDIKVADDVLSYSEYILQPGVQQQYQRSAPLDQPRWLVIGAEFQKIDGARSLVEQKIDSGADFNGEVLVDRTVLSVLPVTTKRDE